MSLISVADISLTDTSVKLQNLAGQIYSVVVTQKVGVLCKNCGTGIEIDDEYLPGIRGAEMAASFYQRFSKPASMVRPWQKLLTCGNPNCRATHTYRTEDLRLYVG
jgi:hypothetical protein